MRQTMCVATAFVMSLVAAAPAADTPMPLATPLPVTLFGNSGFQKPDAEGTWPEGWPRGAASYENENAYRFLRLESRGADTMASHFHIRRDLPAGFDTLELRARVRHENVRHGKEPYNDARFIIHFVFKDGKKTEAAQIRFLGSANWHDIRRKFPIPEGAVAFEISPTHFYTAGGTFDIGEMSLLCMDKSRTDYVALTERLIPDKHLEAVFYGNAARVYGVHGGYE